MPGVTEVNLMTTLRFYIVDSSIKRLESLKQAHELVSYLSLAVFPGELQTVEKVGC